MDKLGKLLPRVLARQPSSGRITEMRLQLAFREILGEELAGACETIEVRGSTVAIVTSSPALAHQLRLDGEDLLRRLNEQASLPRKVRVLRVRTGR